jgi:hypothetical protein
MIFDNIKLQIAEIYYLANTPTYIYRNIVELMANINLDNLSLCELEVFENQISKEEKYLFYLVIYIRVIKSFDLNLEKYKTLKWVNEFCDYCKINRVYSGVSLISMNEDTYMLDPEQKVVFNA